eukprot:374845-Rhodomonas_salina.1
MPGAERGAVAGRRRRERKGGGSGRRRAGCWSRPRSGPLAAYARDYAMSGTDLAYGAGQPTRRATPCPAEADSLYDSLKLPSEREREREREEDGRGRGSVALQSEEAGRREEAGGGHAGPAAVRSVLEGGLRGRAAAEQLEALAQDVPGPPQRGSTLTGPPQSGLTLAGPSQSAGEDRAEQRPGRGGAEDAAGL